MGRVYASADWHGCGKVAKKVLEYLKSDDVLYFIGDITDRGKDGIELLDTLINRPNTYYIKGNHDQMFENTLPRIIKDLNELGYIEPDKYPDQTWFDNGGWATVEGGLLDKSVEELTKYYEFLKNLPLEIKYSSSSGNLIILEHAGYTPFDIQHRHHDPLWDRSHFYDIWGGHWNKEKYKPYTYKNTYLVHGHTPVQYLKFEYGYKDQPPLTKEEIKCKYTWYIEEANYIPKVIQYCDGHKIDIDMCTIASGRIALMDLDTFEVKYFDEGE